MKVDDVLKMVQETLTARREVITARAAAITTTVERYVEAAENDLAGEVRVSLGLNGAHQNEAGAIARGLRSLVDALPELVSEACSAAQDVHGQAAAPSAKGAQGATTGAAARGTAGESEKSARRRAKTSESTTDEDRLRDRYKLEHVAVALTNDEEIVPFEEWRKQFAAPAGGKS